MSAKTKKDLPPLWRMALTYAEAQIRFYSHWQTTGEDYVEDEEIIDRLTICQECSLVIPVENLPRKEWKDGPRCSHPSCGCYLLEKTRRIVEHCPLWLWPGDDLKLQQETQNGKRE